MARSVPFLQIPIRGLFLPQSEPNARSFPQVPLSFRVIVHGIGRHIDGEICIGLLEKQPLIMRSRSNQWGN